MSPFTHTQLLFEAPTTTDCRVIFRTFLRLVIVAPLFMTLYQFVCILVQALKRELYSLLFIFFFYFSYMFITAVQVNQNKSLVLVGEVADEKALFFDAADSSEELELENLQADDEEEDLDAQFFVDAQLLMESAFDGDAEPTELPSEAVTEYVDPDTEMEDAPAIQAQLSAGMQVTPPQVDVPPRMFYWETHYNQFRRLMEEEAPICDKGTGPLPSETGYLRRPVSQYYGIVGMVPMPKPVGWGETSADEEAEEAEEAVEEEDDGPCFI